MPESQLKQPGSSQCAWRIPRVSYRSHWDYAVSFSIVTTSSGYPPISVLYFCIDIFKRHSIITLMRDATFFTQPVPTWQRRYEALRACFVDRLPTQLVAERFDFSPGYVRLLCHQFRHGKIDLSESPQPGKPTRHKVSSDTRGKIIA
jgi:hypothetical protein